MRSTRSGNDDRFPGKCKQIEERARPAGVGDRVALGVAGDDRAAVAAVAAIVDDLGFDPIDIGPLASAPSWHPAANCSVPCSTVPSAAP